MRPAANAVGTQREDWMSGLRSRLFGNTAGVVSAAVVLAVGALPAQADAVADFYKGKTISLIVGTSSGNDYDFRGRLLARHLGRHIPGNPTIVPRNMPGAGGINAANWFANVAPRDGTTVHMVMATIMGKQAVKAPGVQYDARKFSWIGNTTSTPNVTSAWHTSGITSIEQVKTKELIVGAPAGTAGEAYVVVMNALAGTKFKLVTGYAGGNEVNLAMERGEIHGRASNSWASWKSTRPDWVRDKKLVVLVQVALQRHPELKSVPTLIELVNTDLDKKLMAFLSAETAVARALIAPPEIPADRLAALRKAFDATVKDPQFLMEAEKKGRMDITPLSGVEAQKIAHGIVATPPEVIARARQVLGKLLR
jgi:tripartite-type tricarboxylate transporter receptor subunit TctC